MRLSAASALAGRALVTRRCSPCRRSPRAPVQVGAAPWVAAELAEEPARPTGRSACSTSADGYHDPVEGERLGFSGRVVGLGVRQELACRWRRGDDEVAPSSCGEERAGLPSVWLVQSAAAVDVVADEAGYARHDRCSRPPGDRSWVAQRMIAVVVDEQRSVCIAASTPPSTRRTSCRSRGRRRRGWMPCALGVGGPGSLPPRPSALPASCTTRLPSSCITEPRLVVAACACRSIGPEARRRGSVAARPA